MNSIVSEKGQVTIPKKLRQRLGLSTGVVLDFQEKNGQLVATKVPQGDPFEAWRGRGNLPLGDNGDDYLKQIRER